MHRRRRRSLQEVINGHPLGALIFAGLLLAAAVLNLAGPAPRERPGMSATLLAGVLLVLFASSARGSRGAERIVFVLAAVAVGAFFTLGVAGGSSRAAAGSAGIVSSMSLAGMAAVVLREAWRAVHK